MEKLILLVILLLTAHPVFSTTTTPAGTIGVNYGRVADNLPHPTEVVELLKSQGVTRVKIFDTEPSVLSALSGSGISVTVDLQNEHLPAAAADPSFADAWVQANIIPYQAEIDAIAVGNEDATPDLVPTMNNIHAALLKHGASSIKISSPLALGVLETSYPPSSGSFKPDLVEPVIKPMLDFLNRTGSYLMINIYPFFAYAASTDTIPLDYALFRSRNPGNKDPNNGLLYTSLFDAQVDAVHAATAALSFPGTKLVVTETGWPSKGGEGEIGASIVNAAAYNKNLVRRVLTGGGTPLKPEEPLNVYLFALFNENQKTGPASENNYGLFYPNKEKVYDVPLTAEALHKKSRGESRRPQQQQQQVPVGREGRTAV